MSSYSFGDSNALTDREKAENRKCIREHREHWVVVMREHNRSAFNGGRYTPSDYSLVKCDHPDCQRPPWRTKAAYVSTLPDAKVIRTRSADGSLLLARGDR